MNKLVKRVAVVLILLISFFLLVFLVGAYFYDIRSHPREIPRLPSVARDDISYAKVKQVVDGDTVKLESGETVRYIGVDSPEVWEFNNKQSFSSNKTERWDKTDKCYAEEAMAKNKELVEGKVVRLEKDISNTDKFGRLLRNVWVDSCHPEPADSAGEGSRDSSLSAQNDTCSKFVNLELVSEGFAKKMTVPPDRKYEQQILGAEEEAKEANLGLWKACQ